MLWYFGCFNSFPHSYQICGSKGYKGTNSLAVEIPIKRETVKRRSSVCVFVCVISWFSQDLCTEGINMILIYRLRSVKVKVWEHTSVQVLTERKNRLCVRCVIIHPPHIRWYQVCLSCSLWSSSSSLKNIVLIGWCRSEELYSDPFNFSALFCFLF